MPEPPPAAAAPPAPESPKPAPTISLSVDEYQRFRSLETQLAEVSKAQQAALDAKEQERLKILADKEGAEKALAEQRTSWETKHAEAVAAHSRLEAEIFTERKEGAIAAAFAGRTFAGDTPEQKSFTAGAVRRLLVDELETTRDAAGALHVREKGTGRPAAEVLKEKLDSPQFAVFLSASKTGGTGAGGDKPSLADPSKPPEPGSIAESVSNFMKARSQAWGLHASQQK